MNRNSTFKYHRINTIVLNIKYIKTAVIDSTELVKLSIVVDITTDSTITFSTLSLLFIAVRD